MSTATLSQKAPFTPTLGNAQLSASPQKVVVSPPVLSLCSEIE
jgi:hypothetical protein